MARHRRVAAAVAAGALLAACAPDPHDIYTVEAPPATRAPLPTTEPPPPPPPSSPSVDADPDAPPPTNPPPATFPPNGEVVEVRSLDNTFRLETIEVEAGTEVLWINGGRNDHNVLPVDEIADLPGAEGFRVERDDFKPGDEYSYLFSTPGVYPYFCSIHGTQDAGMIGTVIVIDPA